MASLNQNLLKTQNQNDIFRVLPDFSPLNAYRYYLVDYRTHPDLLHHIIRLAIECESFSLDTEIDLLNQDQPGLLKINLIDPDQSTIILFELSQLPKDTKCLKFWLIRSIFKSIFREKKKVYVWGNLIIILFHYLDYGLFTIDDLENVNSINVQRKFKCWHAKKFNYDGPMNESWSLQLAIANTFHENLQIEECDKIERSKCFVQSYSDGVISPKISPAIHHSCCKCLAITKLVDIIFKESS